jgi:hypothetical protein|tara:strand:+ start:26 stop:448 length:423 start_codon:yes stop_codon:yes gene_type:complete
MWTYNGTTYDPAEEDLQMYIGFVYLLTEIDTDMKYIGKKFFWKKVTKPPLKGRKNKRRSLVESDWKTYYGSNDKIKALVESGSADKFNRQILRLCQTKGECSYYEAKYQFDNSVLLRDDYYNGIISCRINQSHVKGINNR